MYAMWVLWNVGESGWNRTGHITLMLICWIDIWVIYDSVVQALFDHMSKKVTGQ